MKKAKGFTLVELVIVIVVIGILAAIAVPRFVDLADQAKEAQVDATVGAIRSALALEYSRRAANGEAELYPPDIDATMMADGQEPMNEVNGHDGVAVLTAAPTVGAATTTDDGYWYIGPGGPAACVGSVGAYPVEFDPCA